MQNEIHCSACGAIVRHGENICAGCGLALTAQAVPAVYATRARFSFWKIALAGAAAFYLLCWLLSANTHRQAAAAQAQFSADVDAGRLSSPAAFIARCGQPQSTRQAGGAIELHYAARADDYVTFAGAAPTFARQTDATGRRFPSDAAFIYEELGCK